MNVEDILAMLKTLGKPQTAVICKRHGSGESVFGVLTSEITKIKKKIKVDHALATDLWDTGNAEARILALLISDPGRVTRADAEPARYMALMNFRFESERRDLVCFTS